MASAAFCGSLKRDFPSVVNGGFRKESKRSSCGRRSSKMRCTLTDEYRTLRIQPGASETEVKKAFRSLALQYHPDVCKGNNCDGVQFHRINEAYDALMTSLRAHNSSSSSSNLQDEENYEYVDDEDLWEEWMGWEGAGIRDYTSHINPYI